MKVDVLFRNIFESHKSCEVKKNYHLLKLMSNGMNMEINQRRLHGRLSKSNILKCFKVHYHGQISESHFP